MRLLQPHNTYMMQAKQLVPNPAFNPALAENSGNRPMMWLYRPLGRALQDGDMVEFLCNGRGRGSHVRVLAKVTKVNRKTFKATEWAGSYAPGTRWTVDIEHALEAGNGGITVNLSWKD